MSIMLEGRAAYRNWPLRATESMTGWISCCAYRKVGFSVVGLPESCAPGIQFLAGEVFLVGSLKINQLVIFDFNDAGGQ